MRTTKILLLVAVFSLGIFSNTFSQTDRKWWNSLSPAWKKVMQKQQFKGKDMNPTDEQLGTISEMIFLDISGNKDIKTLKPLIQLPMLEAVRCNGSGIENLDGIEGISKLRILDCSDNDNINTLVQLKNLIYLEKLNCGNTMVKSLAPLRNLKKLRDLDLHYTTIVNLKILKDLRAIEILNVSENISLYTLEGINFMSELRELNCSKTNVNNLSPLSKLKRIERLDCSDTKVYSLRPIQFVKSLSDIDFSNTNIRGKTLDYLLGHSTMMMIRCKNISISDKEIADFTRLLKQKNLQATIIITKK